LLEYLIILLITMAGMMRLTFWSAIAGACVLVLLPFLDRMRPFTSPTGLGSPANLAPASAVGLTYGFIAATAAYLLGAAIGWLWSI
jgi:hypothetical protein